MTFNLISEQIRIRREIQPWKFTKNWKSIGPSRLTVELWAIAI